MFTDELFTLIIFPLDIEVILTVVVFEVNGGVEGVNFAGDFEVDIAADSIHEEALGIFTEVLIIVSVAM